MVREHCSLRSFTYFFVLTTVLILATPFLIHGCTCNQNPNPPCRAFGNTDVIFDAIVTKIEKIEVDDEPYLRKRVQIRIREIYKGESNRINYVYTGIGDSDCGYRFRVGKRYLIYADNLAKKLVTSSCSRTQEIRNAKEDLDYFAAWPSLDHGIRIFGRVETRSFDGESMTTKPIADIEVEIGGTEKRIVKTKSDGTYSLAGLTAGRYFVRVEPPPGFKLSAFSSVDLFPLALFDEYVPEKACLQADFVFDR